MLCFGPTGDLEWVGHDSSGTELRYVLSNAGPTLADLDGDGYSEVIIGAAIFDHTGLLVIDSGAGEGLNQGYPGGLPAVADLDLDGEPEIVTGARAWHTDGTAWWDSTTTDGYPAIADFDGNG